MPVQEDHEDGEGLYAVTRGESGGVFEAIGEESLRCSGGDELLDQSGDHVCHIPGVEDGEGDGVEQDDEGDERDDGIGGDAKSVGVDLGVEEVVDDGGAAFAPAVPLGGLGWLSLVEAAGCGNWRVGDGGSGM
jgi:hypothetical protein